MFDLKSEVGDQDLDGSTEAVAAREEVRSHLFIAEELLAVKDSGATGAEMVAALQTAVAGIEGMEFEIPAVEGDEIEVEVAVEAIDKAIVKMVDNVRKSMKRFGMSIQKRIAGFSDYFRKQANIAASLKVSVDDRTMLADIIPAAKWSAPVTHGKDVANDLRALAKDSAAVISNAPYVKSVKAIRRHIGTDMGNLRVEFSKANRSAADALGYVKAAKLPKKHAKKAQPDDMVQRTEIMMGGFHMMIVVNEDYTRMRTDIVIEEEMGKDFKSLSRAEAKDLCQAVIDVSDQVENFFDDLAKIIMMASEVDALMDSFTTANDYTATEFKEINAMVNAMIGFNISGMLERIQYLEKASRASIRLVRESLA